MPRSGKGGARTGEVGTAYANRTDLNGGKMPVSAATGQGYGVAAEQRAAQGVIPMGTPMVSTAAPQTQSQSPMMSIQNPQSFAAPGSLPYLEPTMRPDEPVTHGLPFGPGAGPEALGNGPSLVSDSFANIARQRMSPEMISLASTARSLGV